MKYAIPVKYAHHGWFERVLNHNLPQKGERLLTEERVKDGKLELTEVVVTDVHDNNDRVQIVVESDDFIGYQIALIFKQHRIDLEDEVTTRLYRVRQVLPIGTIV